MLYVSNVIVIIKEGYTFRGFLTWWIKQGTKIHQKEKSSSALGRCKSNFAKKLFTFSVRSSESRMICGHKLVFKPI